MKTLKNKCSHHFKNLTLLSLLLTLSSCTNNTVLNDEGKNLPNSFDYGTSENGYYTNDYFNFEFKYNTDWTLLSKEETNQVIAKGQELIGGDELSNKIIDAAEINTAYLFTLFKEPVGTSIAFNPSMMVVAENLNNSRGISTSEDYSNAAKIQLSRLDLPYKFDEIKECKLGDLEASLFTAHLNGGDLEISQNYYSILKDGFSVSFILSYSSPEELKELETMINSIVF